MSTARTRRNRGIVLALSTMAVAGVLIWAKLRLTTDIPRSAYAQPEHDAPDAGITDREKQD